MPKPPGTPGVSLPRWLIVLGSLVIVFHLGSVGVNALAAWSGPWADADGQTVGPPLLANDLSATLTPAYLKPVRLTHNYHFPSNRPGMPGVWLEFRLKDADNNDLGTVKVPGDDVNPWVRHRQSLLMQLMQNDQRVMPPMSEVIAAPGQEVPRVQYWDRDPADGRLKLKTVSINDVPRAQPVMGPSPFAFLMARSYARYLCRETGAAKVELFRHHQDPIRPFVLTDESITARAFDEVISNFGEFSK